MNTLDNLSWLQGGHEMKGILKAGEEARLAVEALFRIGGIFLGAGGMMPRKNDCFANYCSHCGCVLDPVNVAPRGFFDACIECSEK